MNTSTTQNGPGYVPQNPEFGHWPVNGNTQGALDEVKQGFDNLLTLIAGHIPPGNARYLAVVKTKLEEASFFAIKGIAKTGN